jgi:uncharacterized phage protein (predicted DNA packaging)
MLLTLEETKLFLHRDFDDEDMYISQLIQASEDYLIDSIGYETYNTKIINTRFERKARLCSLAIIQDCFENRSMITKENEKLRYMIGGMILQMQYCKY